jgi:hypothetical protein
MESPARRENIFAAQPKNEAPEALLLGALYRNDGYCYHTHGDL